MRWPVGMTQKSGPEEAPDAGGGGIVPDGPVFPDAVPQGVHDLVDGVFGALGSVAGGIGDVVSGFAEAIGGPATTTIASTTVDLVGVLA